MSYKIVEVILPALYGLNDHDLFRVWSKAQAIVQERCDPIEAQRSRRDACEVL